MRGGCGVAEVSGAFEVRVNGRKLEYADVLYEILRARAAEQAPAVPNTLPLAQDAPGPQRRAQGGQFAARSAVAVGRAEQPWCVTVRQAAADREAARAEAQAQQQPRPPAPPLAAEPQQRAAAAGAAVRPVQQVAAQIPRPLSHPARVAVAAAQQRDELRDVLGDDHELAPPMLRRLPDPHAALQRVQHLPQHQHQHQQQHQQQRQQQQQNEPVPQDQRDAVYNIGLRIRQEGAVAVWQSMGGPPHAQAQPQAQAPQAHARRPLADMGGHLAEVPGRHHSRSGPPVPRVPVEALAAKQPPKQPKPKPKRNRARRPAPRTFAAGCKCVRRRRRQPVRAAAAGA